MVTNNIVIPRNIIKLSIDNCEIDGISIHSMSRLKKILIVYTKFCKCNDITLPNTIESITGNCIINEDSDDESYVSVGDDSMSDSSDESCSSVDDNYHDNGICNNDVNCNHHNICNNSNINCSINDNKNHVTINTRNILQRYN